MAEYDVLVVNNEIILPEQVENLFDRVRKINDAIKSLEAEKKAIEAPLKKVMLKNGIDKFQCKYMSASAVKGSQYVVFDEEQMKKDGVYDKYAMKLTKDSYVKINYRKEKDNG